MTMPPDPQRIGLVDGSVDANSRRFFVVLDPDAVVELDELVTCAQALPGGGTVTHYGMVVETVRHIEGADFPSDTMRIGAQTMPGETIRRVEVQILRTVPERWLPPEPGVVVSRCVGAERDEALFLDQMERPLPVGLDQTGQPIHVDFDFVNGSRGGHVSISGVSGVATKTSYALFLLYMLFETDQGRALLGVHLPNTKALVFNTKGEDLLHLDRPNRRFAALPDAADGWRALGDGAPGPFGDVRLYAPRVPGDATTVVPDVRSRAQADVVAYGWTPEHFVRQGLLEYCFTEEDERATQVGFVEQQVRLQLLRHFAPLDGDRSGVIVLRDRVAEDAPWDPDRLAGRQVATAQAFEGEVIRDFSDLVTFLERRLVATHPDEEDAARPWLGGVQQGTARAFVRRLVKLRRRIGHLVSAGVDPVDFDQARVHVVDISRLHDDAQRFVVGALLARVWDSKQGTGREPLRFVVLDELNKYAPREGRSPLKELLVDIAERGRALGVLLIGAQQAVSAVAPALPRNAAVKVVGRLDAGEAAEYRFLSPELRERAARFLPGTMILAQPLVPEPVPLRFPFPAFATNTDEGQPSAAEEAGRADELMDRIRRR
ncbi:MAG TPA: ATP-binding protein [Egibacteraceae bacterium]|nr:ATP-binding protein [Actinomycetota bacterium]HWB71800.1 ATP-binding protein [Egibacteraceae bacterium]